MPFRFGFTNCANQKRPDFLLEMILLRPFLAVFKLASVSIQVSFSGGVRVLMKCVNARLNDELIQFDCPNCGVDVEINEGTLDELWESFDGMVTCPLPDGCNSFIKVPTHEELDQLKNATDENTEPEKLDPQVGESNEPNKPFRYVSKSGGSTELDRGMGNTSPPKQHSISPLAIRTFRNKDCIVQGQNRFDETVSTFLGEIGKGNVISVSPINYADQSDKLPDYGVIVYYQKPMTAATAPATETTAEPVVWRD